MRSWSKAIMTFCNPGDVFLTEEWTYPSALATARPYGVQPIPVKIDGEGMRSDDLRKVLAEWDEEVRGAKRPHLMYTVPVGQNPTGAVSHFIFTSCDHWLKEYNIRRWELFARRRSTTSAWNMVIKPFHVDIKYHRL